MSRRPQSVDKLDPAYEACRLRIRPGRFLHFFVCRFVKTRERSTESSRYIASDPPIFTCVPRHPGDASRPPG